MVTYWGTSRNIKNVGLVENGIANIRSLPLVKLNKSKHIVHESENGNTFISYFPGEPNP